MTLTWKEEIVEQGLNKTQLKEVSEAIKASEERTHQVLDKIALSVQANAEAIECINKNMILLNNKIDDIALIVKK